MSKHDTGSLFQSKGGLLRSPTRFGVPKIVPVSLVCWGLPCLLQRLGWGTGGPPDRNMADSQDLGLSGSMA